VQYLVIHFHFVIFFFSLRRKLRSCLDALKQSLLCVMPQQGNGDCSATFYSIQSMVRLRGISARCYRSAIGVDRADDSTLLNSLHFGLVHSTHSSQNGNVIRFEMADLSSSIHRFADHAALLRSTTLLRALRVLRWSTH